MHKPRGTAALRALKLVKATTQETVQASVQSMVKQVPTKAEFDETLAKAEGKVRPPRGPPEPPAERAHGLSGSALA